MDTKASDIMSTEILVAKPDMCLEESIKLLVNNKITGLPVVDSENKIIGVLSEFDVIQQIAKAGKANGDTFLQKVEFTHKVESVKKDTPLKDVLDKFVQTRVRRLPVVDENGRVAGIITRRDIMRVLYYRAKFT